MGRGGWGNVGVAGRALLSRLSFQSGDALESALAAKSDKDIFLLSAALHGFDDDACVRALRNVAAAAPSPASP